MIGLESTYPTAYFDKIWNDEFIIQSNQIIERPHQNNGHPYLQEAYLNEKLFICGTETSSKFGGYMEGAIRSAFRVADKF